MGGFTGGKWSNDVFLLYSESGWVQKVAEGGTALKFDSGYNNASVCAGGNKVIALVHDYKPYLIEYKLGESSINIIKSYK